MQSIQSFQVFSTYHRVNRLVLAVVIAACAVAVNSAQAQQDPQLNIKVKEPASTAKDAVDTEILKPLQAYIYAQTEQIYPNLKPQSAPVNLFTAYQAAQAYDASFASAKAALAANQEKVIQAKSALRPSVNAVGSASMNYGTLFNTSISGTYYANSLALAASYPVWRPALGQVINQAEIGVRLAQASFANAQQDLIVRVAQGYFDVLLAQDTLASIFTQRIAISEQLAQAKREFEVGTKTILDTNEAQSRYDLMLAQEAVARSDALAKLTALTVLTGKDWVVLSGLRDTVRVALPNPSDINAWANRAEEASIAVQIAQLNADLAKAEIARNKLNQGLTVDLTSSVSYNRNVRSLNSTAIGSVGIAGVGIQANYPLYSGGNLDSKTREAALIYDKTMADLDAARRNAGQAARQIYLSLNYGIAQIKALESAETSSKALLKSTKLGYQVGVRINLDVLNAQQALAVNKTQLAKARYDALIAGLRLKALTTQLSEDDLQMLNAQLQ